MRLYRVLVVVMLACLAGCERGPELGIVNGQITLKGEPQEGLSVKFTPDPEAGNDGASSTGRTDAEGRYTLRLATNTELSGAITGWHRVVVTDPAREDRPPGPLRVAAEYTSAAKTPLKFEVSSSEQSFDIELETPRR